MSKDKMIKKHAIVTKTTTVVIPQAKKVKEVKKSATVVKRHNCRSEFQDQMYGYNMRVINRINDKYGSNKGCCTVCGQIVDF